MSDPFLELLIRCTVKVQGTDSGSGFYIAPRLVLTCAHVVGVERQPGDEGIFVVAPDGKDDRKIPADLIALLPNPDDDLALISVTQDGDDYAWLNDSNVLPGDDLLLYGFPAGSGDTRTAQYEGLSQRKGDVASFHHLFKAGQIVPGFSGGPVLNLRTGSVIGVVTETRSRTSDLGGNAIPLSVVRELISRVPDLSTALLENPVAQGRWSDAAGRRRHIIRQALDFTTGRPHRLPASTPIENFFKFYTTGKTPLIGASRRKQLDELDNWLQAGNTPYLLIAAPAGRGKSALLVRWLEELASPQSSIQSESTRTIFVPISVRFGLNTEDAVFRALVARLEHAYGLSGEDGKTTVDLRESFSEYLSTRPAGSPNILVVLDGLDEAAGWEVGPGLFPFSPADGVKVIVAARTQADRNAEQWLEALGWSEHDNCRRLDLPRLTTGNLADVISTLGPPLASRASDQEFITLLHRLSDGGDPLVLSLYIEDLRRDPNSLEDIDAKGQPSGLEHYFDQWWKQQEQLWRGSLVTVDVDTRYIFNLLATAFGPLPRSNLLQLARQLRPECSGDDLDKALQQLKRFVLHEGEHDAYVLAHPRFADYRYRKLRRDDEHHKYESLFLEWGKATLNNWTETSSPAEGISYIVRYYGAHLKRMERPVKEFMARVGPAWQAAWDALADDYNGYFGDVAQSFEVARNSDRMALARGNQLPFIGEEWRCVYALADRKSFAESLAPNMLGPLLQYSIWSGRQCLTFIQQLDPFQSQAEGLAAVIPHLPPHLLAEAEPQLALLKTVFQETIAPALKAYSVRLWEVGEPKQALDYVKTWPRGSTRNRALVSLSAKIDNRAERSRLLLEALDLEDLHWIEISDLFTDVCEEFAKFGVPGPTVKEENEWVTPGLSAEARAEGLARTLKFINAAGNSSATVDDLVHLNEGQHLGLVLPWVTLNEAARLLGLYFDSLQTGDEWVKQLGTHVFQEIAPFVKGALAVAALEAAETIGEVGEHEAALAILTLAPALAPDKQAEIVPRVLAVAKHLWIFSSTDDLCDFVVGLVKLGLANEVLELIRKREARELSNNLVEAILPHLNLEQTTQCLSLYRESQQETFKYALPAILARFASFGPKEARTALLYAQHQESVSARPLVSWTLDLYSSATHTREDCLSLLRSALFATTVKMFGLDAVTALNNRALIQLSVDEFFELTRERGDDLWAARILTTLTPYLSIDAALDPDVQSAYIKVTTKIGYVEADECISALCSRLVELGEKSKAIEFALHLVTVLGSGVLPPAAIRAIPNLNPDLIERQRWLVLQLEDPFFKCIGLATIAAYIGDESWLAAWHTIVNSISRPELLDISFRIKQVLEVLPKAKAEQAFADSFGERFADQTWRNKFFDCRRVLVEIGRYYPAKWFEDIKLTDIRSESGTYRSMAFGTVAIRLAELGQDEKALEWLQQTSHSDPETVAEAIAWVPIERIQPWLHWILNFLPDYEGYSRIWQALRKRGSGMSNEQAFALYERWLDMVAKRPQRWALIELLGFLPAIEQLGGKQAFMQIRAAIDEL